MSLKLITAGLLSGMLLFSFAFAGTPAADFTHNTIEGKEISLSDYKGNVVLVDFWATWCPPCRMEIPHFNELFEEYGEKGFAIIGVSIDRGGAKAVADFMKNNEIAYPVVLGDNNITEIYQGYLNPNERNSIPFTFLIDKKGVIRHTYVGYKEKVVFEADIKKLLAEKDSSD